MKVFLLMLCACIALAASGCGDKQGSPNPTSTAARNTASTKEKAHPNPGAPRFALQTIARNLESPTHIASPPGDRRLFVVERAGRIVRIEDGGKAKYLDIRSRVTAGGEQGLLSVAFHPNFASNGKLYVDFTDLDGHTRIIEYRETHGKVNADTARELLKIEQPYSNHNGGQLAFGPDGYLYIGMGDGGDAGDPGNRAQDRNELLGKILRIDVDRGSPYAIPDDNPYAQSGGAEEIWMIGARNPWRFSFDRKTYDLYIADVGQYEVEEINVFEKGTGRGANLGWNILEGTKRFTGGSVPRGTVKPIHEYSHDDGSCSITGGFVYRGRAIPSLTGYYLYADFCDDTIRTLRYRNGQTSKVQRFPALHSISSFGEDAEGEIYVASLEGTVSKIVPKR